MARTATTKKATKKTASDDRRKKKGVRSIYIPDDLWRKMKIEGAMEDKTISGIIRDMAEDRYARKATAS